MKPVEIQGMKEGELGRTIRGSGGEGVLGVTSVNLGVNLGELGRTN